MNAVTDARSAGAASTGKPAEHGDGALAPQRPRTETDESPADLAGVNVDLIYSILGAVIKSTPTVKDLIVHEGGEVWIDSARGAMPMKELPKHGFGEDLLRRPSREDIKLFMLVRMLHANPKAAEQVRVASTRIADSLRAKGSFSESIRLDWDHKARAMLFKQGKGRLALNVRISRAIPPSIQSVGLPQQTLALFRQLTRGLVLLTGPLSSGKTTAAQALLNHHNMHHRGHIVTIEDPIETDLRPSKCLITPKDAMIDCGGSFNQGLQDGLRQAVTVLFIGELRDVDSIRTVLNAAASGILVIATMHGDTCVGALSKMITQLGADGPAYCKVLAQNLVCVLRHAMVPGREGDEWHPAVDALMPQADGAVADMIAKGEFQNLDALAVQQGSRSPEYISMNETLRALIAGNKITLSDARLRSSNPKELTQK